MLRVPSWYRRARTAATSAFPGCARCTDSSMAMARDHSCSIARLSAVSWHAFQSAARTHARQLSGETRGVVAGAAADPDIEPIAAHSETAATPRSGARTAIIEELRGAFITRKHRSRLQKCKRLQFRTPRVGS